MTPGLLGAISPQEQRGLLEPYERQPSPLTGLLGDPVLQRMGEASQAQQARWAAGERSPTPLTEDNMWLADDVAGSLVGPLGMAGIFAGVGAKTADKAALRVAKAAAREGKDPRSIWHDTGWFQGPDGKWRWEIDDSGARYKPDFEGPTVRDAMEHGSLFEAYPDMAGMRAERVKPRDRFDGARQYDGTFSPESGIGIHDELGTKTGRSTMLHELQHGVQEGEGFAQGGNPAMAAEMLRNQADQQLQGIYDELGQTLKTSPQMREMFERRNSARAMKDWDSVNAIEAEMFKTPEGERILDLDFKRGEIAIQDFSGEPARNAYRRLAGEAEARAVQARRDMTPEQRRATFPMDSLDVPPDELIVRGLLGDGPQMSVEPDLPDQIAGLLRDGRASEVTDEMLGLLNPNQSRRLVELYEQGATGMPMPMDEASRMARAREMGFDGPMYHGTKSDIGQFDMKKVGASDEGLVGRGVYSTYNPEEASGYALNEQWGRGDAPNVMPVSNAIESPFTITQGVLPDGRTIREAHGGGINAKSGEEIRRLVDNSGSDGVVFADRSGQPRHEVTFDPANIRSRFARFDPRLAGNANLLASMGGAGLLGYGLAPEE